MINFKYTLLNNWHLMRIIRLVVGVWLGILAIRTNDWIPGLLGVFLLWQAITNTACCSLYSCGNQRYNNNILKTEIEYEEIK